MNAARWTRVTELLERVEGLSEAERAALLVQECGADVELRREVESLARSSSDSGGFLEPPQARLDASRAIERALPAAGELVGGYELVRPIARGGMGMVYEALQRSPRRKVALKVVDALLADADTLRRFRWEAEVLGRLRHPSIAQVHEAGADVAGDGGARPFLAIEFVEGARHLTAFVREERLDRRAIVRLLLEVCSAVQHGHDRGVIHRDLKPSNVLVDGAGRVKVIDFGVARVLGEERVTRAGELVGTLQYMSPEQLEGDLAAIDVRADVYALGALLYELLLGRPPIDTGEVTLSEALRRVREETPPRPRALDPGLPPELEWILDRALEKDRARRYASVAELAADLTRWLAHEPVRAGPPSAAYRARKFVRRHGLAVGAGAAVLGALIAGLVLALRGRSEAIESARRAGEAEARTQEHLAAAEKEARTNRAIVELQRELLRSPDPDRSGRDVRVIDVLARASSDLDARDLGDPEIELALREAIAEGFTSLQAWKEAAHELDRMRPAWEALYGELAPKRLELEVLELEILSVARPEPGRADRAERDLERVVRAAGAESALAARWELIVGRILSSEQRWESAEAHLRSASATFAKALGPTARETIEARLALARLLYNSRQLEEASAEDRDLLELCRSTLGEDNGITVLAKESMLSTLIEEGRLAEAETLAREVVLANERRTGAASYSSLQARIRLAYLLRRRGDAAQACSLLSEVLASARASFGESHRIVLEARMALAIATIAAGRRAEGIGELEATYGAAAESLGPDDPAALDAQMQLVKWLYFSGRFAEAEPHARECWERSVGALGERSPMTVSRAGNYATLLVGMGQSERGIEVLRWVVDAHESARGPDHPDTILVLFNLGAALVAIGQGSEAECLLFEVVDRCARRQPAPQGRASGAWRNLGRVAFDGGDYVSAIVRYGRSLALASAQSEGTAEDAVETHVAIAYSLSRLGDPERALPWADCARLVAAGGSVAHEATRISAEICAGDVALRSGRHALAREILEAARSSAEALLGPGDRLVASAGKLLAEIPAE